ncbi:MAG TPA: OmpH family outer membrane protein [Dictyoglomaceae bacterium]|mgnify:CR=1 FL=1|nr:OmpH family outer membrane protein [Dictyoglomaceae bacterium]HOL39744.1 OmpH family outer membrane protein [Dictyoglomaceae bacterium]HOP95498.1 OmpH family outer membrane protein [Dictyoglomaceae bacterium]HPP16124.1 OmpH family outer membrane protein [Dictyoglomaceae bacterium]HPU43185.1 OmpH family outer membrane protein [Dictyoglomaceae bacterium]
MKGWKHFLIIFIVVSFFSFSFAFSDQNRGVAYIDYPKVFSEFKDTKKVQSEIQKRQENIQKLLDNAKKKGTTDEKINEMRLNEEKKLAVYVEGVRQNINAKILKEVEKVAKSKKISVVLNKSFLLWGGIDITSEVLNNLNK